MAHEKLKPTFVYDEEKIEKLKQIAPECFEDGKINFETLKQNLGEWSDDEDESLEHFGLFWPGKKQARRAATLPPEGTLEPVFGDGLKPDGTTDEDGNNPSKNIFIEGENLEVLKLLQKSYADKIKMIYIDPPYNTGNDFVYDDDFTEPLQEYLRRTGQVDEEGKSLTTNKRSDGRFHSKWLSMMYPRLRLARNLLKEDGVIFVSIDDNEVHNLRCLMNEIFGEENFLGELVINSTPNARDYGHIGKMHEYCLFYSKDHTQTETYQLIEEGKDFKFKDTKGGFNVHPLYNSNESFHSKNRPNLYYPFYLNPINEDESNFHEITLEKKDDYLEIFPPKSVKNNVQFVWRWGKQKSLENLNSEIIGYKTNSGEFRIVQKMRHTSKIIRSLLTDKQFSSRRGTAELEELMGAKVFSFPKPIELVKTLIEVACDNDDIVLDFFAGSGTTAQAVWELSKLKKNELSFILVQLPEVIPEDEKTAKEYCIKSDVTPLITSLTKIRLNKSHLKTNVNIGFKTYKLNRSNFKKWSDYKGINVKQLTAQFEEEANSPFASDWNDNKLYTEILLLEGFPLDAQVEDLKIGDNSIKKVTSELVSNQLLICLDENIGSTLISDLVIDHNSTFICLDNSISNQDKLRLSDKGLIKTI
jgi:adenine-specific DNA-methyltransferase